MGRRGSRLLTVCRVVDELEPEPARFRLENSSESQNVPERERERESQRVSARGPKGVRERKLGL